MLYIRPHLHPVNKFGETMIDSGNKIKVLDKGYVKLLNISGAIPRPLFEFEGIRGGEVKYAEQSEFSARDIDPAICARISFDNFEEERTEEQDLRLVEYLMANKHTSPLEFTTIWLEMKLPIFVARQFCLGGSTELHFENGKDTIYRRKLSIKEAYRMYQAGGRLRQQLQTRKLRKLNLSSGEKDTTNIKSIWRVGIKPVYELEVESAANKDIFKLTLTKDHRIYTESGWKSLEDLAVLPTKDDISWELLDTSNIYTIGRNPCTGWKPNNNYEANLVDEQTEIWISLYGWEGYYEISSQGRVRNISINAKSTASVKTNVVREVNGYKRLVTTCFAPNRAPKQIVIARAMLQSFIGNEENKQARHLNGNSFYNTLNNLAWGTDKQNKEDSLEHKSSIQSTLAVIASPVKSIRYLGLEEVYDLEVSDDEENFVAGGVVVHNCRHRTVAINEVSARYTTLPEDWYIPEIVGGKSTTGAKQGQEDNLTEEDQEAFKYTLNEVCAGSYALYKQFIEKGVAPEHARLFLHVNHYTHWIWKQDLHNLMHFLSLRLHSHAQVEAREYAKAVYSLVKEHLPKSMELFDKYRRI
jgi:flavin-dependent thymidylate synthase